MHSQRRLTPAQSRIAAQFAGQVRNALNTFLAANGRADNEPLLIERAERPTAPAQLAASHPGPDETRRQIQSIYEECLVRYREDIRPHDGDMDDAGVALASFVEACVFARTGTRPTATCRINTENQMSGVLRQHPMWVRAGAAERQTLFERFAILAVFVWGCAVRAAEEGPQATRHVRQAAASYLQELFGVEPDRLGLGPDGVYLRG